MNIREAFYYVNDLKVKDFSLTGYTLHPISHGHKKKTYFSHLVTWTSTFQAYYQLDLKNKVDV